MDTGKPTVIIVFLFLTILMLAFVLVRLQREPKCHDDEVMFRTSSGLVCIQGHR